MKVFIDQGHNLLPDCAFESYIFCDNCMSGFFALILMSKSGKILFRSMPNRNYLFSSAFLSLVGNNSLVHEFRQ